jgi:hypothetical protein
MPHPLCDPSTEIQPNHAFTRRFSRAESQRCGENHAEAVFLLSASLRLCAKPFLGKVLAAARCAGSLAVRALALHSAGFIKKLPQSPKRNSTKRTHYFDPILIRNKLAINNMQLNSQQVASPVKATSKPFWPFSARVGTHKSTLFRVIREFRGFLWFPSPLRPNRAKSCLIVPRFFLQPAIHHQIAVENA